MDHKWKADTDGAESCEREGCTVRKFGKKWQRRPRGRWELNCVTTPIPPCAGKEAAEVKAAILAKWDALDPLPTGQLATSEPPSPSPLEVVRDQLRCAHDDVLALLSSGPTTGERISAAKRVREALSALATLEESIRADELAMAITRADDDANNHPLTSTSMRLRVRLSELRGKAESLEKWEESIRKDEREKCHADALAVTCGTPRCVHSRCGGATAVARIIARRTRK